MRIQRKNKWILLISILLLAVGTLIIGGTFASGTDLTLVGDKAKQITNTTDYQVNVTYQKKNTEKLPLMTGGAVLTEDVSWCPGRSEVLYLEFTNQEAFQVQINLSMKVTKNEFDNMFTYAVVNQNLKAAGVTPPANWAAFKSLASAHGKMTVNDSPLPVVQQITLQPAGADGSTYHCALGMHMDENATSQYTDKQMKLNFVFTVNANYQPNEKPGN